MNGPITLNPSDSGTKKKWRFRNDTGERICDFFVATGPESFLEIEWPWGESGNPPDIRKFTIREESFEDASKEYDDETEIKATIDPCVEAGKEFEIELEFDDPFEPNEYVQISPTDANGVVIENENRTETTEPNTGTGELIDTLGKAAGEIGRLVPNAQLRPKFAFDEKREVYILSFAGSSKMKTGPRRPVVVKHLTRKRKANGSHKASQK